MAENPPEPDFIPLTAQQQNWIVRFLQTQQELLEWKQNYELLRLEWEANGMHAKLVEPDFTKYREIAHLNRDALSSGINAGDAVITALGNVETGQLGNLIRLRG